VEVKEYIESGILELFVLDELNPQEKAEVLDMASRHPEVRSELLKVQQAFEVLAVKQGIEPAATLKSRIEAKLEFSDLAETDQNLSSGQNEALTRTLAPREGGVPAYPVKFYAYALAACFTLLVLSTLGMYSLWNRLKETQRNYDDLVSRTQQFGNQVAYLKGELGKSKTVMNDPDFKKLALAGTKAFPSDMAVVWWNQKKHTVMIDPAGLPRNDSEHSYQLWAIVNGKPVDAGVFEVKGDLTSVSQLKDIESAQAFAVTIEKKGGSESPTLSEMVVMASI
jgi:anti-sigma-K factor RskA